MSQKDRGRASRKQKDYYEEDTHHQYRVNKSREQKKSMRTLERALKSKDYNRLMNSDDIY